MKRKLSLCFYFLLLNLTCSLQRPVLLLGSSWCLFTPFLHLVGTFILKLFSLFIPAHLGHPCVSVCSCSGVYWVEWWQWWQWWWVHFLRLTPCQPSWRLCEHRHQRASQPPDKKLVTSPFPSNRVQIKSLWNISKFLRFVATCTTPTKTLRL